MGSPTSLLAGARAFARDFPRDQMPKGYLWDIIDYVPEIIDASLTGRGGWAWGSDDLGSDGETGVLAGFTGGDQLLIQTVAGRLIQVNPDAPYNVIADRGPLVRAAQNPVFRRADAIWFDRDGATVPTLVRAATVIPAHTSAPKARYGTNWGKYLVVGNIPGGDEHLVRYSHPSNQLENADGWDAASFVSTAGPVTGLAALRAVQLVFHASTVERIRGSTPPNSTIVTGDLTIEPLFTRVGCTAPQSIAYWNENVIFADEHGVHLTDGAVIRNLANQGGISYFWRTLWGSRLTVAACVFLDYYQITIRPVSGPSVTLICDLNKRQWFRFQNVYALSYIASGGSTGMERVWGGMGGTGRLARIAPCYFPTLNVGSLADADGAPVMPEFETPWYRLGEEGRKRVRFAYLSYDVRSSGSVGEDAFPGAGTYEREHNGSVSSLVAASEILELSYIRSPQQLGYVVAGTLPATVDYRRYRLPIGQFPYGIAFKVRQTATATANRIFDFGVEQQAAERSRV